MAKRDFRLRLTFLWLGLWSCGFGAVALIFPDRAIGATGLLDVNFKANHFITSLLGSFLIPWGLGMLLAARANRPARNWVVLALIQTLAGAGVAIFFLGEGALDVGIAFTFLLVFAVGAGGLVIFGHDEIQGRIPQPGIVLGADRRASSQEPYTVSVEDARSGNDN